MFARRIQQQLLDHLARPQVTVLTGMRRTGKTTLVKQLLKQAGTDNTLYIDFERVDHRELFSEKNYENILYHFQQLGLDTQQRMVIGLDELQLVPQAPSVLKYLSDHHPIKWIVTGSSSYYLKNLFNESLSGRKKIFELYPLDFGEFLTFRGASFHRVEFLKRSFDTSEYERLKALYEEFLRFGGFPEVVLSSGEQQKQDLLRDIISSYINIDVKTLADFRHQDQLYSLLKILASRVGSRLDYSKLSRIVGLNRITLQSYIDFLEKTYVIRRISVMGTNPDRHLVKAQKCYFLDNGLLHTLAETSSGTTFENGVFTQLHHYGDLRYFSLKSGREIDFIMGSSAIEVKESPTAPDQDKLSHLALSADIKHSVLVGRRSVPHFKNYVWGGDIR